MNITVRDLCCLGPAAILLAASGAQAKVTASSSAKITITVDSYYVDDEKVDAKPSKLYLKATPNAEAKTTSGDKTKDPGAGFTDSRGEAKWDWEGGVAWKPGQGIYIKGSSTVLTEPVGWAWHRSKADVNIKAENSEDKKVAVKFKIAWEWAVATSGDDKDKEEGYSTVDTGGLEIMQDRGDTKIFPPGGSKPGKGVAFVTFTLEPKGIRSGEWFLETYDRVAAKNIPSPTGFLTLCGGFLAIGRRRRST
ncbi:MAG: hypothetical protein IT435_16775 [Phycisphaerales bacterium]|nr:hypothetical protein [Phycisphaerales bacterium]